MSDDTDPPPIEDPDWKDARTIWATGGLIIPEQIEAENAYYLTDLKLIAAMVHSADAVNQADRSRKIAPKELAELCNSLSSSLLQIDNTTFVRMASGTALDSRQILNDTVANLFLLEAVLDRTVEPSIPRKRKHELHDIAIIRLADIFEHNTKANASVTKHWEESPRKGKFVNFVLKFYELMLPGFVSSVSGRSIQASLEKRLT